MKNMSCSLIALLGGMSLALGTWGNVCHDVSTGNTWTYSVMDDATADLRSFYTMSATSLGSLVIPSTLDGYPVTSIGKDSFANCVGLASVTIPSGVTSIGRRAFSGCVDLKSVTIPPSVMSIGREAFEDCSSLMSVTISSRVTAIGKDAFENCRGLKVIYVDPGDTIRVRGMLLGCIGDKDWDDRVNPHELFRNIRIVEGTGGDHSMTPSTGRTVVPVLTADEITGSVEVLKATVVKGCLLDAEGRVAGSMELKIGKEGSKGCRLSGSAMLFGGRKLAVRTDSRFSARLSEGPADVSLSVVRGGRMNVRIGGRADGSLAFAGSWGDYVVTSAQIGGEVMKTAAFLVDGVFPRTIGDDMVNSDYLPSEEPVMMDGRRWKVARPATVRYARNRVTGEYGWIVNNGQNNPNRTNLSALKLSYTSKTGVFRGAFTIYLRHGTRMRKVPVRVDGLLVDGVGYGMALIRGVGGIAVLVQ